MHLSSSNTSQPWALSTYSDRLQISEDHLSPPDQDAQSHTLSAPLGRSSDNDSRPWALYALDTAPSSSVDSTPTSDPSKSDSPTPSCLAFEVTSFSGLPSCSSFAGNGLFPPSSGTGSTPASINTLVEDDSGNVQLSIVAACSSAAQVKMPGVVLDPHSKSFTTGGPTLLSLSDSLEKISLADLYHAEDDPNRPNSISFSPIVTTSVPPPEPVSAIPRPLLSGVTLSSGLPSELTFANDCSSYLATTYPDEDSSSPHISSADKLKKDTYTSSNLHSQPIFMFNSLKEFARTLWDRITFCLRLLL
ncbi:hypothetical protein BXZ70DRAFT_118219 [Cristinia sonorae]|uniref:Uncharacterized protein n=1 Tax=Cristinia sonorae TaxID=1940300 RepID=A0A8K0XQB4_9AGAR|nr:hypothetical protein BXZ70DRAFT_118219 [Cristinia sonorae]